MSTTVKDCANPRDRLRKLGLAIPNSLDLLILPRGFDTAVTIEALTHESDAATLRKLLAGSGLLVHQVQPSAARLPVSVQKSVDWIAPTLFVTTLLLTENPRAIHIALGVIESYNPYTAYLLFACKNQESSCFVFC